MAWPNGQAQEGAAAPAASERMQRFIRAWKAQFGDVPRDWSRRNDPESSWAAWRDFMDHGRTQIEVCEAVIGRMSETPTFAAFKRMYFDMRGSASAAASEDCSLCGKVRWLYAVCGIGQRKDGTRGRVITGPWHRAVPLEDAAVVMVRCECNPSQDPTDNLRNRRFATMHRPAAEQHAEECRAAWARGDVTAMVDDSRIPPGEAAKGGEDEYVRDF